jgi:hypothetical protein
VSDRPEPDDLQFLDDVLFAATSDLHGADPRDDGSAEKLERDLFSGSASDDAPNEGLTRGSATDHDDDGDLFSSIPDVVPPEAAEGGEPEVLTALLVEIDEGESLAGGSDPGRGPGDPTTRRQRLAWGFGTAVVLILAAAGVAAAARGGDDGADGRRPPRVEVKGTVVTRTTLPATTTVAAATTAAPTTASPTSTTATTRPRTSTTGTPAVTPVETPTEPPTETSPPATEPPVESTTTTTTTTTSTTTTTTTTTVP